MSNLKRRLAAGMMSAGLIAIGSVGLASTAQAAPAGASAPAAATGMASLDAEFECGPNNWVGKLVPDNPPGGADFHSACVAHDTCYSTGSTTSRIACDEAFLSRMRQACADEGQGSFCNGIAQAYYYVVRTSGGSYYKGSGAND